MNDELNKQRFEKAKEMLKEATEKYEAMTPEEKQERQRKRDAEENARFPGKRVLVVSDTEEKNILAVYGPFDTYSLALEHMCKLEEYKHCSFIPAELLDPKA